MMVELQDDHIMFKNMLKVAMFRKRLGTYKELFKLLLQERLQASSAIIAVQKVTMLVIVQSQDFGILIIMEHLVKIYAKARILELKRRHLKNLSLTTNTPYPARRYGVSVPALHQKPRRFKIQHVVDVSFVVAVARKKVDTPYWAPLIRRIGSSWSRDHVQYLSEYSSTISWIRRIDISWMRRIDLQFFVVFGEVQAHIRLVFLIGHDVLDVRNNGLQISSFKLQIAAEEGIVTKVVTEMVVKECLEKAMTSSDSSLGKPRIDIDLTIELGRFFYEYFPFSRSEKNYKIINFDGDGPEYYEFMTWLDSKFKDKRKIDRSTKSALWHSWVKGWGNESIGDTELSDEEWDEADYGNPPNAISVLFFKPYLDAQEKNDICITLNGNKSGFGNHNNDTSI
ncbi:hypothetical protein Tco_1194229 [Tanacetum coccineum]